MDMEIDDVMDPKVGVAVAATAVALSPRVRDVLHHGAVYGVAGVLAAGDAVSSFARGIGEGVRRTRAEGRAGERMGGGMGDRMAEAAATSGAPESEAGKGEQGAAPTRRGRRSSEPSGGETE